MPLYMDNSIRRKIYLMQRSSGKVNLTRTAHSTGILVFIVFINWQTPASHSCYRQPYGLKRMHILHTSKCSDPYSSDVVAVLCAPPSRCSIEEQKYRIVAAVEFSCGNKDCVTLTVLHATVWSCENPQDSFRWSI
jgi:hypothetical protein